MHMNSDESIASDECRYRHIASYRDDQYRNFLYIAYIFFKYRNVNEGKN